VAINDEYGDGRDVSWLYDVDFTSLSKAEAIAVSGSRAHDMALRLGYDEVSWQQIEADPLAALDKLLSDEAKDSSPVRIYCTYTAMMKLHPYLEAQSDAKRVVG
jgi:UDP-N-acetylmuramyl tripeptide synthase